MKNLGKSKWWEVYGVVSEDEFLDVLCGVIDECPENILDFPVLPLRLRITLRS